MLKAVKIYRPLIKPPLISLADIFKTIDNMAAVNNIFIILLSNLSFICINI